MIRGDVLVTMRPGAPPDERPIAGDEELLLVLWERFGLAFPPGTRVRPRGAAAAALA